MDFEAFKRAIVDTLVKYAPLKKKCLRESVYPKCHFVFFDKFKKDYLNFYNN